MVQGCPLPLNPPHLSPPAPPPPLIFRAPCDSCPCGAARSACRGRGSPWWGPPQRRRPGRRERAGARKEKKMRMDGGRGNEKKKKTLPLLFCSSPHARTSLSGGMAHPASQSQAPLPMRASEAADPAAGRASAMSLFWREGERRRGTGVTNGNEGRGARPPFFFSLSFVGLLFSLSLGRRPPAPQHRRVAVRHPEGVPPPGHQDARLAAAPHHGRRRRRVAG